MTSDTYVAPWPHFRFVYVNRADGTFTVVDTGGSESGQMPRFVATCETKEMADLIVHALRDPEPE